MNEEQLLSDIQEGKSGAFQRLVELYQNQVINICYRFVRDKTDAEDLAQETFIEVYFSINRFRQQSSLGTWIHRIAVSKSLDLLKQYSRLKRGGGSQGTVRLDARAVDIPAPSWTGPDRILEDKESLDILTQALNSLPKKQHVALILSTYDGMTYQEIADTLGTSLSAVESLIYRARENLKKKLRTYYERSVKKS
ncbi:MAG TPA: sigma-70 family RNA polymerase sigma factor [candidate division Zixibacteria bacterium]|nr:sigma-70 family RNA polymerase sigma factor [candidate division Zixibacteria bacterium]